MIDAESFVEAGRRRGFNWYTGVPCSFIAPFINYVIGDESLQYIAHANEGDAVATAAGLEIAGQRAVAMMQNSGLGNAVSPLTSLNNIFRLPVLLICTHRGAAGAEDEPQHSKMGAITGALFETMGIPWRAFPAEPARIEAALDEADSYMQREQQPFALVMQKGTVAKFALSGARVPVVAHTAAPLHHGFDRRITERASRGEALARVIARTPIERSVVIATTGYTGRELYAQQDRDNQAYVVGSMGCSSSFALGLALAKPDREVVVIDGDGAALMRMGNFAIIGTYGGENFTHLLLDNEVHDSTGAQASVSANVSFGEIAAACGYRTVISGDDVSLIDEVVGNPALPGPRLLHLKIRPGTIDKLPRPTVSPAAVTARLRELLR
ncbi:MAG: phosphonopyruvate decarboxylase [Nitrococcus mobilis]|nr:phosphonopyruvate decarboxylase [Nitrococcus mobilis]